MRFRKFFLAILALAVSVPSFAVFNEEDLSKTLSVLRVELKEEVDAQNARQGMMDEREIAQHRRLIGIMKKCNELSLMLYSQNQDYTFDLTYALKEVTKEYEDFNKERVPFDDIIARLDLEIERYSRLVESLRRLPPQLHEVENLPDSLAYHNDSLKTYIFINDNEKFFVRDSLSEKGHLSAFFLDEAGQQDRDSCLCYAIQLLKSCSAAKDHIKADSDHYEDANMRLKESYDYAQLRYKELQKRIFMGGQDNYFMVIRDFPAYCKRAFADASKKYGKEIIVPGDMSRSEWHGPMVISFLAMMLLFLVIATVISHLAVAFLRKRLAVFQKSWFDGKWKIFTLFCGIVIFALTNGIGYCTTANNFFRLATGQLVVLSWLLAAITASVMVRNNKDGIREASNLFLPLVIVSIIIIAFRIVFIPNTLMNLIFSPLLLAFCIWQICAVAKAEGKATKTDKAVACVSAVVIGVVTIMSWTGFVLLGVQVLIWWLFQVAAIETVMVLFVMLDQYDKRYMEAKRNAYSAKVVRIGQTRNPGDYIRVTWFYDFLRMCVIPVLAVVSVPLTIFLALNVFDLTDVYDQLMYTTFFDFSDENGREMFKLSLNMIVLATSMYFFFRYLNYAAKALYRVLRLRKIQQTSGKSYIHTNEVNLTLANNVISILIWGTYIVITIILLRIPTGAVSIIAAGLATGLGLAMKDILNNFIYGIQLMSGRLRVGDWVECDGVRGKVTAISYQSTQMETTDGAVMSFLNTSLFNKNFKNLTRNNDYEFVKIVVGVAYGTDVERARQLLLEAVKPLQTKDEFYRNIVDMSKGVSVTFEDFGDSSVNIAIKQYVLVPERTGYIAAAKEAVYNKLKENGIEIPFPQRDIHIVNP